MTTKNFRPDRPEISRWLERVLWILAVILIMAPAAMWLEATIHQRHLNASFDRLIDCPEDVRRARTGETDSSTDELTEASGLVGRIKIDRLSLSAMIEEGVGEDILSRAVGHMPESPLPGEEGNVVLAAHRDTFFRPLQDIKEGDIISLETIDGRFLYEVVWTEVVAPEDIYILDPTDENSVTLVTCYPFGYIGPAPQRFIVKAHQVPFG